jgi:hypothetical protein
MSFGSDGHSHQQNLSITTTTSADLVLPKFQTAYSDIEDRRRSKGILNFDIQKIDSSITLSTADNLCIVSSGEKIYKCNSNETMCSCSNIKKTAECGI